jgi:hypothetical protein
MRVAAVFLLGVLAAGCGGAEPRARADRERPPASTPVATETPAPEPKPARSAAECLELWNDDEAIGSTHQVSHTEFTAELARERPTPAQVLYRPPDCFVVARISARRIAVFAAGRGRAPYTVPERMNLTRRQRVDYNARVLRDGRIRMR